MTGDADGATTIRAGSGGDTIVGGTAIDTIVGGTGNDTITGGGSADNMTGNAGNDIFIIGAAADHATGEVITAGAGSDTIRFTSTTTSETLILLAGVTDTDNLINVTISDAAGATTGTTALNVTAANLTGTLAVNLTGNDGANTLTGTANTDTITGNGGNDVIVATAGNDTVTGGAGSDKFQFTAALIEANSGTTATYDGGGDTNTLEVTEATTGLVDADLRGFTSVQTLQLTGASTAVLGTNANTAGIVTVVTGNAATSLTTTVANAIAVNATALEDNATLTLAGDDVNYTVTGLQGNLSVNDAHTGNVAVTLAAVAGGTTVAFGTNTTGTHSVNADALNDGQILTLTGSDIASVSLVDGDLSAATYAGALTVTATTGTNVITTGTGADIITGGAGADTITGGAGDDSINLTESTSSADTVVFAATAVANGTDTVTGFTAGTDLLNVSAFETVGALVDGTGTYTIAAGQVVYLGGQAAGAADSTAAAITALNSAGVVTAATQTNWIVISDDNSTAIYSALNNAANTEYTGATLTLVATIDTAITHAQLATAIVI